MKNIIAVLITMILGLNVLAEEIEVTLMVNDSHQPYVYVEEKAVKGIYIAIMKLIDERLDGYKIKFDAAPWKRVKTDIEKGEAVAFMPPYYHGHDWLYVWPYSLSIMEESVIAICRNEIVKTPRLNWPKDYLGLKIANNSGYDGFGGAEFRQYVKEGKIQLEEAKTTEQNIQKLILGRNDCYMANRLSFAWEIKKLIQLGLVTQEDMQKITESVVISTDAVYVGFTDTDNGKFPFKRDFHQKLNNELYKMYKSGEIKKIAEEYVKQVAP